MLEDFPSRKDVSNGVYFSAPNIDIDSYDHVIVCLSGGKDSIACLCHLIDIGVDLNKVELWHHDVDGREGSSLMDWPFMRSYVQKFAEHFQLKIYFSWLEGGFEGEMLKNNAFSKPHHVQTPDGLVVLPRKAKSTGTRLKFPQQSASLQTRWCSSALKIDVARRALNAQERFHSKKTLFITGERRQESANRARYNQLEPHICSSSKKVVDSWRPVLEWDESQVWDALKRHHITPPIPYRLGWSRSSCMKCIFNDASIWATLYHHFAGSLDDISQYEKTFGVTISRSKIPIIDIAKSAKPLEIRDMEAFFQALKVNYELPIITNDWEIPAGAYRNSICGPS